MNNATHCGLNLEMVVRDKKQYLDLLLLADPSEAMIDRYLDAGIMFVAKQDQQVVGVAVVSDIGMSMCELKNLAVAPACQRQGIGSGILARLLKIFAPTFAVMLVGTSESAVPFYERFGFSFSYTIENFFTDNYPEPLLEGDRPCINMLYLKKDLHF